MKKYTFLLLLATSLLIAACSKTKNTASEAEKNVPEIEQPSLPEFCQISGTVTDDRGIGIQEAAVELYHVNDKGEDIADMKPYPTLTARGGGYSFKFPCGKSSKVAIRSSHGRTLFSPTETINLNSGKIKHDIKLKIRKKDLPCDFNNAEKKPLCHICKKDDMIIPYRYGMPSIEAGEREKAGEIRLGGCVIAQCQASWYCKRDEVDILMVK